VVRQIPEVGHDRQIEAALNALQAGRAARAEAICRERLGRDPESVEFLRLLAQALLRQSRLAEAELVVRKALALRPSYPPSQEDLGSILMMQGRHEEAVRIFEHALQLDQGLPLAQKNLGRCLAALGRAAEADAAFEKFFEQDRTRVRVAFALDHLKAGRKEEAIRELRRAVRDDPDDVDALRHLAQIFLQDEQRQSDAEAILRRVTALTPGYADAWAMLGTLLHRARRCEEASQCNAKATELDPGHAIAWSGLGNDYARIGRMEESAEAYRRAVELEPKAAGVQMSYAHVLKSIGSQSEALAAYRRAVALKPELGEAYWSMANLKVVRFEDAEVAAMEAQVRRDDLAASPDIHFRFALGKAYEDKGDYDRAWEYYLSGNQKQRAQVFHDPVGFEVRHERIAEVFSGEFMQSHAGEGFESDAPIFIVGLPRSGSTLVEQILASHSQVEGTLELPTLGNIAESIGRYRRDRVEYPLTVRSLRPRDFRAYGRQYLEETQPYRATDLPRFTDKLPNNFSHIGLAHLILPNAKVINARRHPLDSILGNYKQLFGMGQNFTYDLTELIMYYQQYHAIMKHWHALLPGKVLDVHYEETVGDLETQVRRILGHCGLPFEEACLRFHETQRAVRTASSEQVRQPLYTRSLGNWRRYEKHLAPWMADLEGIIAELPESVRNAGL
jgi:tetratricopeptide (TPR) repeat protein